MASIFRRKNKVYTLKEFYESSVKLPVIIYIEEGFAGNNAVETIGAGQYFFIHAVYRQRRAMMRGQVSAAFPDKCLLSIPVAYPIKFRRVESRLNVGSEDFLWSLLRKFDPPFQVQMSRTDRRTLTVGPVSTRTSDISNLLVMGKYKEIYLLGNLLNHGTGGLYYKHVTAIPLYVPEVKVRVVDGFSEGMDGHWMQFIDELYAFALQEIDLHGSHGNRDIAIFIEETRSLDKSEICEYLVPDRYISLQWSEGTDNHANVQTAPNSRQYQPSLRGETPRYTQSPTTSDTEHRRRRTDTAKPSADKTDEGDEVINVFSRDYTPLDEIRDLKRPAPAPRQRKPIKPTAPPEDGIPPQLPPRYRHDLNNAHKEIETPKDQSSEHLDTDDDEDEDEDENEDERKPHTPMPLYNNRTYIKMELSKELSKMFEKKQESEMEGRRLYPRLPSHDVTEPEIDYETLPPKRQPNVLPGRREVIYRRETDSRHNGEKHRSNESYVTHMMPNDSETGPVQTTSFDPQMTFARMTIDDVVEVLRQLNLYKYEAAFRSEMVDGFMLGGLTDDQLRNCFDFTILESKRLMNFILHRHLPKRI